ncbi:MAG: putative lyase [Candidatus Omnitrophica bacterium ADurb.Bin277]|nr:MAG: putative lyase [Candidatus Omnitrophica bacterium ADurb.Bin277]
MLDVLTPRSEARKTETAGQTGQASDVGTVFGFLAERDQNAPQNPDVLIVLGNPKLEVTAKAAVEAFLKYKPKRILASGKGPGAVAEAVTLSKLITKDLTDLGFGNGQGGLSVPFDIEADSMHTGQNAEFSAALLKRQGAKISNAILVQMPTGMHLSRLIFEKQFNWDTKVDFYSYAPELPVTGPETDPAELDFWIDHALGQIERLDPDNPKGAIKGNWILPGAGAVPENVAQAALRIRAGNVKVAQSTLRSETRLTPEQERQFQKVLRDIQPKWWDGNHNGSGGDRRIAAIKTLGEIKDPRAVDPLISLMQRDIDVPLSCAAVRALGGMNHPKVVPALVRALEDNRYSSYHGSRVDQEAKMALVRLRDPASIELVIPLLSHAQVDVASMAAEVLASIKSPRVAEVFAERLVASPHVELRKRLAGALAEYKDARSVDALIKALKDVDDGVCIAVTAELLEVGDKRSVAALLQESRNIKRKPAAAEVLVKALVQLKEVDGLIELLGDPRDNVCALAAAALGASLNAGKALPAIIREAKNQKRQQQASKSLVGALRHFKAVDALIELLGDPRDNVCALAVDAIGEIGDRSLLSALIAELYNDARSDSVYKSILRVFREWKDPMAIPALLQCLRERFGEDSHRLAAGILSLMVASGPGVSLKELRRYFDWIGGHSRTYKVLSDDEVAGIQTAYMRGESLLADYREEPEETHEETTYDIYGNESGSYSVTDKAPHLDIFNIRSRNAMGVEVPVTRLPKPARPKVGGKLEVIIKPFAADVTFWDFKIPSFDPNQDGLIVSDARESVARLMSRSWLWPHLTKSDPSAATKITERIARLKAKITAIIAALYESKLISQVEPLVELSVMGSYVWKETPNDLDLIVVVAGDRAFERVSAEKLSSKIKRVIPGLPVNVDVVGLSTLQKALRGEDVPMAKVIRRRAMPYYSATVLSGVDLWHGQPVPLTNFTVMRNDLLNDIERAVWNELNGDAAKIEAKKKWRQTEADALSTWLAGQWKQVLEGVRVSVEQALQNELKIFAKDQDGEEAALLAEVAKLRRDFAAETETQKKRNAAELKEIAAQQEQALSERAMDFERSLAVRRAGFERARLERQKGERKKVFELVKSRIPRGIPQLSQALDFLDPSSAAADTDVQETFNTIVKQFHLSPQEAELLRIAAGIKQIPTEKTSASRSEARAAVTASPDQMNLRRLVSAEVLVLIREYYFGIAPIRVQDGLEHSLKNGTEALIRLLKASGVSVPGTVHAAMTETEVLSAIFSAKDLPEIPSATVQSITSSRVHDRADVEAGGVVYAGSSLFSRLLKDNPRALYLLLRSFHNVWKHTPRGTPVLETSGDASLRDRIRIAIENRKAGIANVAERNAVLADLDKFLKVNPISDGQSEAVVLNGRIAQMNGRMATIHLDDALLPSLEGGVNVAIGERMGDEDLLIAAGFAVQLTLFADASAEALLKQMQDHGMAMQRKGTYGLVISHVAELATELVKMSLIARSA